MCPTRLDSSATPAPKAPMSMSLLLSAARTVECGSPANAPRPTTSPASPRRIPVSFLLTSSASTTATTTATTATTTTSIDTDTDTTAGTGSSASLPVPPVSPYRAIDSCVDSTSAVLTIPPLSTAFNHLSHLSHHPSSSDSTLASLPTSPTTPPPPPTSSSRPPCASSAVPIRKAPRPASRSPRRRWNAREDALLVAVVSACGAGRWNEVAARFPGRNGRQVRLRWMNHLQPTLDRAPWRADEDETLLQAQRALGNRWSAIAARLGGRTDNSVKNRFKSLLRRAAREERASVAEKIAFGREL